MSPLEIFEYKNQWMNKNPFTVQYHSDSDWKAKQWCKANVERQSYKLLEYTDVYEHTACFENADDANSFLEYMNDPAL